MLTSIPGDTTHRHHGVITQSCVRDTSVKRIHRLTDHVGDEPFWLSDQGLQKMFRYGVDLTP
jgi:hypothetical protein